MLNEVRMGIKAQGKLTQTISTTLKQKQNMVDDSPSWAKRLTSVYSVNNN